MKPYVARQGDYLTRLAFERGFSAEGVWDDPANRELNKQREDMNVLLPGDLLQVPAMPRAALPLLAEGRNVYRAVVPTISVDLVLRDSAGPISGEGCRADGLGGGPVDLQAGADGHIALEVPVHVREVRLCLHEGRTIIPLRIGHMDPLSEPSGVRARLANLGYVSPAGDGELDDHFLIEAIREFQRREGLPTTGEVDDDTRRALRTAHRS